MKSIIVLALLVGVSAHAEMKSKAIRVVPEIGAAAKGGAAAMKVGTGAAVAASNIRTVVAAIHAQNAPAADAVASFQDYISKVQGLQGRSAETLVNAFRTTVVDKGCLDAHLSADAYSNLSATIDSVVAANMRQQTSINGLAYIAKNSDLNGDGVVSADETAASDLADSTLTGYAADLIRSYSTALKKTTKDAVPALTNLATRCGLNPAFAARFATASAK